MVFVPSVEWGVPSTLCPLFNKIVFTAQAQLRNRSVCLQPVSAKSDSTHSWEEPESPGKSALRFWASLAGLGAVGWEQRSKCCPLTCQQAARAPGHSHRPPGEWTCSLGSRGHERQPHSQGRKTKFSCFFLASYAKGLCLQAVRPQLFKVAREFPS